MRVHCDEKKDEARDALDSRLIAVAGDLSKPLLGMDDAQFRTMALEIDSIIHSILHVNK